VWLNAVGSDLEVGCLSVGDRINDLVNYEMWMSTNNNYDATHYWVEAGMTAGTLYSAPGQPRGFLWFWADSRPGGGYSEHNLGNASVGTYTNVSFYWVSGTGNWDVYLGGNYVGTSTNNGAYAGGSQNGLEVTTANTTDIGNTANWQYQSPQGTWYWVTGEQFINTNTSGLLSGYANNQAVHAQTASCSSPYTTTTTPATPQPVTSATLKAVAERFATVAGDVHPSTIRYVKTTRQAANKLVGTKVNADQPVYMIQMTGTFAVPAAKVPTGGSAPKGTTLTVTVDAATGQVDDWGIDSTMHNLSALGTVAALS
jgi:hypothetical protein